MSEETSKGQEKSIIENKSAKSLDIHSNGIQVDVIVNGGISADVIKNNGEPVEHPIVVDNEMSPVAGDIGDQQIPLPPDDDDDDDDEYEHEGAFMPPLPPDGGWGWMVVVASLFCNMIVDGVCFSYGVFHVKFVEVFGESQSKTAWVGSLVPGTYLTIGPIVSALANKFGIRQVTIVGSIIAGIFYTLSGFAPNLNFLIFSFGIMGGLGFGLMYLPCIVIVGYYFDKRRAFATGIAVCGSGIGTFIFAPLAKFLLDYYGWQGALWITGAICFNGIVCGAIFRPLQAKKIVTAPNCEIMKKIAQEKKRQRTISNGSLNGAVITKKNVLLRGQAANMAAAAAARQTPPQTTKSTSVPGTPVTHPRVAQLKAGSLTSSSNPGSLASNGKRSRYESIPPLNRGDVLYSGSIEKLPEFRSNPNMSSYVQSMTSIPQQSKWGKMEPLCQVIRDMLDFSLMRSLTFCLLCTTSILAMIGFFTPFVYCVSYARSLGIDANSATLLVSILGASNTIGRVISGFLSDLPCVDCLIIHNVALIVGGVATACVPFLTIYPLIAVYCCIFGLCIAAFVSLRSIVFVDLLGIQKLTNSFGLILLFQGISSLIGSPIAGMLFDLTQSYTVPFVSSGVLIALGGAICLPIRRIARWEEERKRKYTEVDLTDMPEIGVERMASA